MTFQESLDTALAALGRAAWDDVERALADAESLAAGEADQALVSLYRASVPVLRGEADPDLRIFRENVVRRHSARHVAIAGYYILMHLLTKGDIGTAERYLGPYLAAVRELADPAHSTAALDIEATVDSLRGRHVAAIERLRAALAELETYARPDALLARTTATHNLAYNCLAANRFADALPYADASVQLAEELGRKDILAQVLITAAFAHLCCESLDEAARLATRAEPSATGTRMERYAHYVLGEVARRRGNRDEAAAHFRRLEKLYPDIPGVAEILLSMNVAPFLLPE